MPTLELFPFLQNEFEGCREGVCVCACVCDELDPGPRNDFAGREVRIKCPRQAILKRIFFFRVCLFSSLEKRERGGFLGVRESNERAKREQRGSNKRAGRNRKKKKEGKRRGEERQEIKGKSGKGSSWGETETAVDSLEAVGCSLEHERDRSQEG